MYSSPCTNASCPEMDTGPAFMPPRFSLKASRRQGCVEVIISLFLASNPIFLGQPTYFHGKVQLPISMRENTH